MSNVKSVFIIAPGPMAGAEKVALHGVIALVKLCDCELIVIRETRAPEHADTFIAQLAKESQSSINIQIIDTKNALDLSLFIKIYKMIKKFSKLNSKLIIHTHDYKSLIYSSISLPFNKFIHTHHGNTAHTFKVRLYEWLALALMNACQAVIAVSKKMESELKSSLIFKEKVHFIANLVALRSEIKIEKVKEKPTDRALKLLFAGRLSPEKGLRELLQVMTHFGRGEVELTIIGAGVLEDELRQFMNEHPDAPILFKGFRPDVALELKQSDFLILPSHTEGLPLIILEAAAMGTPVIASAVGGIPEIIIDAHNGILVPAQNQEALKRAIDDARRPGIDYQQNAYELSAKIWEIYSPEVWAQSTFKLYQETLAHS